MILGHVRDLAPGVVLILNGENSGFAVEFVLDTGFEGEIAIPASLLPRKEATYHGDRTIRVADGTIRSQPLYEAILDWDGEMKTVNVLVCDSERLPR